MTLPDQDWKQKPPEVCPFCSKKFKYKWIDGEWVKQPHKCKSAHS